MSRNCFAWALGFLLAATAAAACNSQTPPAESAEAPVVLDAPSAAAIAVLEKADAADGSSDKIVTKCVACKLQMDGNAEQSVTFGEYELYFCTDFCKAAFTKDPEKALENLTASE